jgi:hypothetical protein
MSKVIPTDVQLREKMEEMTQVVVESISEEELQCGHFVAVLSDKFNGVVDLTSKKKFIETTMGEIIDSMDCDDDDHPAARGEEESISEEELQLGRNYLLDLGGKNVKQTTLLKKTGSGTGRDKKSSKAAKKREITKFKTHFDPFAATLSEERLPKEWPSEDDDFKSYLINKIEQDTDMDENAKERLKYVLENSSSKMKQVQVCWMIAKSFAKVPRGGYKPNTDCPVCKVAEKRLVDMAHHNCKYCRSCYDNSGWKQVFVLHENCRCKKDDVLD